MKFVLLSFFLSPFLCLAQNKCVSINGIVKDKITNRPVEAVIEIQINNVRKKIATCDKTGTFSLQLPCETTHIILHLPHYRTVTLPLNNIGIDQPFFVELFMIPNDKESTDKPYMQSEQKDLIVKPTEKNPLRKSGHWFIFSDAYTKKAIDADLCLFYNKKDTVECYKVVKGKKQQVVFNEEDIVAIEVKADGYEEYSGNIHIRNLDNRDVTHEISLLKVSRLLSLSKPKDFPEDAEVNLYNADSALVTLNKTGVFYHSYLDANGKYKIKTTHQNQLSENLIDIREGLNFYTLNLPKEGIEYATTTLESDHQTAFRVYFDQSNYKLIKSQEKVLDAVLAILKVLPASKIEIVGHTDNIGNPELNLQLSEFRARVCFNYFVSKKIDPTRMVYDAYGGSKPIAENDTEENRIKNRRVEIRILK